MDMTSVIQIVYILVFLVSAIIISGSIDRHGKAFNNSIYLILQHLEEEEEDGL